MNVDTVVSTMFWPNPAVITAILWRLGGMTVSVGRWFSVAVRAQSSSRIVLISNGRNTRRVEVGFPGGPLEQVGLARRAMRQVDAECRRGRPPEALVQPQHDAVAALGPLDRLDDHAGVVDGREAVERDAVGDPQRVVEPVALAHDLREVAGRRTGRTRR